MKSFDGNLDNRVRWTPVSHRVYVHVHATIFEKLRVHVHATILEKLCAHVHAMIFKKIVCMSTLWFKKSLVRVRAKV